MRHGLEKDGHCERRNRGQFIGHQLPLDFARDFHFAIHALFVVGDARVELGIDQRRCNTRGQGHQKPLMVVGEVIQFRAFEAEYADDFAFRRQRHDEFGKRFAVNIQVPRIFRDVAYTQRFVQLRGRPNESGARRQGEFAMFLLVGADDELWLQQPVAFVEEKDGKNVIVDSRFNAGRDLLDEFIDLER